MFLVKANTDITVQVPADQRIWHVSGWMAYTTFEDRIYENEDVWDRVTVLNGNVDVPEWARRNIMDFDKVVIHNNGRYAMVPTGQITYLD